MPSKPAGPPRLLDLPSDIRHQVLSLCSATDLLSVSRCCLELSAAAKAPELWAQLLQRHHGVVLDAFFEGAAPPPPHGSTWQRHFFHFERTWLLLARAETGRMLLRMRSECAASSPTYLGVPPPAVERAFTLRLPLLGLHLPIPLWLQQPAPTYGIFDATDFAVPAATRAAHPQRVLPRVPHRASPHPASAPPTCVCTPSQASSCPSPPRFPLLCIGAPSGDRAAARRGGGRGRLHRTLRRRFSLRASESGAPPARGSWSRGNARAAAAAGEAAGTGEGGAVFLPPAARLGGAGDTARRC